MTEKPPPYPSQPSQGGYPPQQSGYPPIYSPQQAAYPPVVTSTTIIQQPPAITVAMNLLESPVAITCPNCQASVVTGTNYVTGTLTWLVCFGLCIIGCDAGCCLIPFCVDSMKDVVHVCPSCRTQVGVFRRM